MVITITDGFCLSDEHASSSYGIPVLVGPDGTAYGPGDFIDEQRTALDLVQPLAQATGPAAVQARELARRFAGFPDIFDSGLERP